MRPHPPISITSSTPPTAYNATIFRRSRPACARPPTWFGRTLPDQPTLPKEDEASIKLKWNYQICMQEIEFHGMNLLSRLRHVEVNEGIVDTIMEEGEMPADEDEAAQP